MTIEQILIAIVVIGIFGSAVEKAGIALKNEKIENIGKAIESVTADLPKIITNVLAVFKAKQ